MHDPDHVDPAAPEPSADSTMRLPAGMPADPYSTQQLNLTKFQAADRTQKLPLGVPAAGADQTRKMALPRLDEPPIRVQRVDQPVEAEGQTQDLPHLTEPPRPFGWRRPLLLGGLLVLGTVAFLFFSRGHAPEPPSLLPGATSAKGSPSRNESLPPDVQVYMDQARAGDTHAMRMLGAMYLQGLNVPKDREKGLYWYRLAADKGSDAARSELSQIEGGR